MTKHITLFFFFLFLMAISYAQPSDFENPVLPGFNPDPSICRVGEDYYMVTSSFVTYPGILVYHSKDLVNWSLIGYGINRPGLVNFDGLKDENGIWAATIRYHEGLFYLITNCHKCGENFYVTASNPQGPWSDPVWLKDAKGIDPSLFWDDDGKCYYTGNDWDFKKSWPGQVAIWVQELDLKQQKLIGERKILSYGYANNAAYAEGPHIYKINNKYLLLASEGGTDQYHAITAHHSNSIWGPYIADKINPVFSHRQLGARYPLQAVGHADLVQTQKGEWWAVVLGKRSVNGADPLTRETFLCKVEFEDGTPIFNPGFGKVLLNQKRPDLPWSPIQQGKFKDKFEDSTLALKWQLIRVPENRFYQLHKGLLIVDLKPQVADSLLNSSMIVQRIQHFRFSATTKMIYKTSKQGEQAGLIIYRGSENYYALLKDKSDIVLIRKHNGKKEEVARLPYTAAEIVFNASVNNSDVIFSYGEAAHSMKQIGSNQSIAIISESSINRFNGPVVGMYATSNGAETKTKAFFEWFEYKATE
ncbi:MAG TPA: glycoside hydrolase family 43 protein [Chitinophagaceae bacterium]|jgi:alpha-N-arabinofuranosidase|nr:glycoside hydrolase family 43 protein [Chitinophagaceae bacterium]HMU56763.1 glycoside hydrolase family 43 protein [Chitinophagaceae bacterium]